MPSIRVYKEMPPLNAKQIKELEVLKNMDDNEIDCSDIPELTKEELKKFKPARLRQRNSQKIAG